MAKDISLSEEYRRQFPWRNWESILSRLPIQAGQTVLDLGCGPGDLSAALSRRGAQVIGVDGNPELIQTAQALQLPHARFLLSDLQKLNQVLSEPADGLWCSFTAAYFPDFSAVLKSWRKYLRPGAWVAITDVDDLFNHEPLPPSTRDLLEMFTQKAYTAGRYDFQMGRKLTAHLEAAGFPAPQEISLPDQELSFQGPALPEVLEAWRLRFSRLKGLQDFAGTAFAEVERDFLACLTHPQHASHCRVVATISL